METVEANSESAAEQEFNESFEYTEQPPKNNVDKPARSLFERAHGTISLQPVNEWPLPEAPAPSAHRPVGSVGPCDPTTLGLHRQAARMRIATSAFGEELWYARKPYGYDLHRAGGKFVVGALGNVTDTTTGLPIRVGSVNQQSKS